MIQVKVISIGDLLLKNIKVDKISYKDVITY